MLLKEWHCIHKYTNRSQMPFRMTFCTYHRLVSKVNELYRLPSNLYCIRLAQVETGSSNWPQQITQTGPISSGIRCLEY